ncbi:MAG: FAD-dependent oxidoreductase [Gammaproteobacteria bacterium]|nr:FAD-dependent oxidoreductase [Gammaproteobacteria bacterium]MDH3410885.1 FAD-dependent oxidoreductase [Gammaproteobacteria bacterium]
MNIAIVGSGIAGITSAFVLAKKHRVTVFEANHYIGGHTNTIDVREGSRSIPVDTGFIVFNQPNYPNLCKLFQRLGVESRDSDMSFSVRCEKSAIEYNGSGIDALFAQRSNLFRPDHWRMITDILRFNREAPAQLREGLDDSVTVSGYLARHGFSDAFARRYLLPLGASLWSCSAAQFGNFPMRFVIEFLHNHRMLQVDGRPVWKTVRGGSREYVRRMVSELDAKIRLSTPVAGVRRERGGVAIRLESGDVEHFDEAIMACHADQSLRMVEDADGLEHDVLVRFPYQPNQVVLHTDTRVLPERKKAWASWNYRIPARTRSNVTVTYNLNMLQGIESERTYCVSLNLVSKIDASKVIRRISYDHPLFVPGRSAAQSYHGELIRRRGVSYCGAYWGYGFHEDGVRSALNVCSAFSQDLERAA